MINFMELRLLVREYHLFNGKYPFLKDIFKMYKDRIGYKNELRHFSKDLYTLQKQGLPIGFPEEETTYTYKYKGKTQTITKKIKRLIVR